MWNYKLDALRPIFFLETILFVLSFLLTLDFGGFDIEYSRQMLLEKDLFQPIVDTFQVETGIRQVMGLC